MTTPLSPIVRAREIDLTTIVPAVSVSEAGMAGQFQWGPLNVRTLVGNEEELVNVFWRPNNRTANDWFTCSNYLSYSNRLWVVRVADETNAKNATASNNSGFLVTNEEVYLDQYADGSLDTTYSTGPFIAKYAGALGNSLQVSVCPSANAYQSTITGTAAVTANSATVTGNGTSFTTETIVGDLLVINNETHKISAITNTTSLTLATRHISGASANTVTRRWEYYPEVETSPGNSNLATALGGNGDEMHVVVVDEDGLWTGVKDTILETYQYLSKGNDATLEDGTSNYYKERINRESDYVWWAAHPGTLTQAGSTVASNFGSPNLPLNYSLVGGNNGNFADADDKIRGYNLFLDKEEVEVSFILGSDAVQTVTVHIINNILENRKDAVGFFSPPRNRVVNNGPNEETDIVNYRNLLPSSSYAVLDSNWKYQYDRFNDVFRYVPLNGDIAGLHAQTDNDRDAWWAAAGLNRGRIKNVIKLAERDILYKNGINPAVTFPRDGTVLFGQKTLLSRPSAFDRINVRRLFIVLRKAITRATRFFLFEFNDEITRANLRNLIEPYLRDVQGRRGIFDFQVVVDERNNTPEVIDRNELICDIYVKPTRVAEFITLNFIATRTGVEFNEVIGRF